MAKNLALVVVVLALTVTAYFGLRQYRITTNTPERVMQAFVTDLVDGKTGKTYEHLSSDMRAAVSPAQWQGQVGLFRKSSPEPKLITQESVRDTFNTYPVDSDPQRFVYSFSIDGRDYLATVILYKHNGTWLVDEFQGEYK
ncbi:MAG TPA: hypothetical protein VF809_03090 [Candidatus Saccharimonadales bacterium]